jgi:hypothetical protein
MGYSLKFADNAVQHRRQSNKAVISLCYRLILRLQHFTLIIMHHHVSTAHGILVVMLTFFIIVRAIMGFICS